MDAEVETAVAALRVESQRHHAMLKMLLAALEDVGHRLEVVEALSITVSKYVSTIDDILKAHLDALKAVTPGPLSDEPPTRKDPQAGIEFG